MSKYIPQLSNSNRSLLTRQATFPQHPDNILALIRNCLFGMSNSPTFVNTTYGEELPVFLNQNSSSQAQVQISTYLEELINRLLLQIENLNEIDILGVLKRIKHHSGSYILFEETLATLLRFPCNFNVVIELIKTKKFDVESHDALDVVVPLGAFECLRRLILDDEKRKRLRDSCDLSKIFIRMTTEQNLDLEKQFFLKLITFKAMTQELKEDLLKIALETVRKAATEVEIFFFLLSNSYFSHALELYERMRIKRIRKECLKHSQKYVYALLNILKSPELIEFKLVLAKKLLPIFNQEQVLLFLEIRFDLGCTGNPVRTAVTLLEILGKIRGKFPTIVKVIEPIERNTKEAITRILSQVYRPAVKRALLEEEDDEGITVLERISKYLDLVTIVGDYIHDKSLYNGHNRFRKGHFTQMSLFGEVEQKPRLRTFKKYSCKLGWKHGGITPTQFWLFQQSVTMKYLMHFIIMVLLLLFVQLQTNHIIAHVIKFLYPFLEALGSGDGALIQSQSDHIYEVIYYFSMFFVMEPLFILAGCFIITDIFLHSTGRRPSLPSIGLLLILTYQVLLSYACYQKWISFSQINYSQPSINLSLDFIMFIISKKMRDLRYMMSISYFLVWMYIIYAAKIWEYVGTLIEIVILMLVRLLPFAILQGTLLFLFSMAAVLSFNELLVYDNLKSASTALLQALLGQFDMEQMTSPNYPLTKAFFIVFLIANAILMLNLLIALLLDDYSTIKSQSKALYLQWLVSINNLWQPSFPNSSPLSHKYGPLAILNILYLPFIKTKFAPALSKVLNFIHFIPCFVLLVASFVVVDILLFFKSYFLLLITRFKVKNTNCCQRFGLFFLVLGAYPLCSLVILARDVVAFTIDTFSKPTHYLLPEAELYTLPILEERDYRIITESLRTVMTMKRGSPKLWEASCLKAKEFVQYIRQRVGLRLTFSSLLSSINPNMNHALEVRNLRTYNSLKRFIWQNSFKREQEYLIHPLSVLRTLESIHCTGTVIKHEQGRINKASAIYPLEEETTEQAIPKGRRSSAFKQFNNWQKKCGMMICGIGLSCEKDSFLVEGLTHVRPQKVVFS